MGIVIFEKNKIDVDAQNITITATDAVAFSSGQEFVSLLRNRSNNSGWATTDSNDSANTTLVVGLADAPQIDTIILVGCNFKSYTIQYFNGTTYVDFVQPINVTTNNLTTVRHQFTEVSTQQIRIVIRGTFTANQDKFLRQLIITKKIGEFTSQPHIRKPRQDKNRKSRKMLSGRVNVTRSTGAFSCELRFPPTKTASDMDIALRMFESINGFLVWLCGGDTSQFPISVPGFRLEDIFLMSCTNDLDTEWNGGHFSHGQTIEIQLAESRT
jgi:hypothetical protein